MSSKSARPVATYTLPARGTAPQTITSTSVVAEHDTVVLTRPEYEDFIDLSCLLYDSNPPREAGVDEQPVVYERLTYHDIHRLVRDAREVSAQANALAEFAEHIERVLRLTTEL